MALQNIIGALAIVFLFSACSSKEYRTQNAAFIVFKTPAFKYADMGFIYENDEGLKTEIYGSGQALMSLELTKRSVCLSLLECMDRKAFNAKILSAYYPEDTLENIFRGRAIFGGLGVEKNRNGFTQKLEKDNQYAIDYRVLKTQIHFRDTINAITITVKKQ
jgi:hypothetical protein